MKYIFVSGIHGVGKTTLLNELSQKVKMKSYSVSDLIRLGGEQINKEDKHTKHIRANQDIWKDMLKRMTLKGDYFLFLDGHFVLLDHEGKMCVLPDDTFTDTGMKKIVVIIADPNIIKERLQKRDNAQWDTDVLTDFQSKEIEAAQNYAKKNRIPIFIYKSVEDLDGLERFIRK